MAIDTTLTETDAADLLEIFGVSVSDVQDNVQIGTDAITGTSKYLESVNTFDMDLGHNFLVLHITAEGADEIKACMDPTQGSGLVTLDETGVIILQMKSDKSQSVKVVATGEGGTTTKTYSISGMTFNAEV